MARHSAGTGVCGGRQGKSSILGLRLHGGALALFAIALTVAFGSSPAWADQPPATLPAGYQTPPAVDDFTKGTWTASAVAGYDRECGSDPRMAYGAVGVGYFPFDHFSVNAEFRGYYAAQDEGRDAGLFELDLLIRHHLVRAGPWTFFVDASAGVSQSVYRIPAGGTHFNFVEEAGVGATYRIGENCHLIGGARYWHLSNARIEGADRNPGLNGVGGYVGVLFTF